MHALMAHTGLKRWTVCQELARGRLIRCLVSQVRRFTAIHLFRGPPPTLPRWPTTLSLVSPANPRHLSQPPAARRLRLLCRYLEPLCPMRAPICPSRSILASTPGELIPPRRRLSVVSILRVIGKGSLWNCLVVMVAYLRCRLRCPCNIG